MRRNAAPRPYAAPLALGVAALIAMTACTGGSGSSTSGVAAGDRGPEQLASSAATPGATPTGSAAATAPGAPSSARAVQKRDVVRTATLGATVTDLGAAAARVRTLVASYDGVVANEELRRSTGPGSSSTDTFTLRVPEARFDAAVEDLATVGTVTARTVRAEDVTGQVADTAGRVKTMQASLDRTRALMARAASIEDITRLESELTRREADLEGLQAQLATLRSQAAMSTITLSLTQPAAEARAAEDRTGFQAGWHAGWRAVLGLLTALAALLGFSLPLVLPLAVVVVPLVLWWHRRRARRRG